MHFLFHKLTIVFLGILCLGQVWTATKIRVCWTAAGEGVGAGLQQEQRWSRIAAGAGVGAGLQQEQGLEQDCSRSMGWSRTAAGAGVGAGLQQEQGLEQE